MRTKRSFSISHNRRQLAAQRAHGRVALSTQRGILRPQTQTTPRRAKQQTQLTGTVKFGLIARDVTRVGTLQMAGDPKPVPLFEVLFASSYGYGTKLNEVKELASSADANVFRVLGIYEPAYVVWVKPGFDKFARQQMDALNPKNDDNDLRWLSFLRKSSSDYGWLSHTERGRLAPALDFHKNDLVVDDVNTMTAIFVEAFEVSP